MIVSQITIGRFHHFHLARQLQKYELLNFIYTGYPRFKLKDELGIPPHKIRSFPWVYTPYRARGVLGLKYSHRFEQAWYRFANKTLDYYAAASINTPQVVVALSGSGYHAGLKAQAMGGFYICDRGSSHIQCQESLLLEEYKRYGFQWDGLAACDVENELLQYEAADLITIPSSFCYQSFIQRGVSPNKLRVIPYGARLERFYPPKSEDSINNEFVILFVGHAGARKGFIDLIQAFDSFHHPNKKLVVIGSIAPECHTIMGSYDLSSVHFCGRVSNSELIGYYHAASVFVLPSIEEGLAMVLGEALACGCPVIATINTGGEEFIEDGVDGFIVPIRSPETILDKFYFLADNPDFLIQMRLAAAKKAILLDGWNSYGRSWIHLLQNIPDSHFLTHFPKSH